MSDVLEIFGVEYTNVAGIKATNNSDTELTYIRPQGTKSITANGTGIDVAEYSAVDVAVSGGNTFIVTLQYNSNTTYWEPNKTYAEIATAAGAGKDIITECDGSIQSVSAAGSFSDSIYEYWVREYLDPQIREDNYTLNSNGLTLVDRYLYDDTSSATLNSASQMLNGITAYSNGVKYTGNIVTKTSSDLTASGATVTAPAGYYSSSASKTIPNVQYVGALTPHFYVDEYILDENLGKLTTHYSLTGTDYPVYQAGYASTSDTVEMYNQGSDTYQLPTQAGTTITPSTSQQTAVAKGKFTTGAVTVSAMPTGTAGTPTATKGAVSNHSVSVTPSVTNATGYITGGTKTGTAVNISASELVSGSETKTENGTYDVTNLAELVVNVSGGGSSSMNIGTKTATLSASASSISFTGLSGNPLAFVVTSSADQTTGGTKVVAVAYDGTSFHGMDITTQMENDTGFSKSYSSGTLTITATSATFEANEYKLVYAYGGSSSDIHTSDVQVGSGATSITFSGLSGRPLYFSCVFKSTFSTSSGYQRVVEVVNDGTNIYGHAMDSEANAQTSWSYTYSGGSLTISSQGTNQGGYFHQPGYYQLTYAVDPNALSFQNKTGVGASTSSQTIYADNGYDALESVQIDAVSQTNLTAANIKSGTTISISNGTTNLWSVTGTYTGGGGSASIDTKTTTASNRPTSLSFTSMKGQPIVFFLRCTSSMSRSSNSTYYYVATMQYNGTNTTGNCWRMSNGNWTNITSGYSFTYSGTTLTVSSSGTTTTSPGCFYPGNYELVYIY